MQEDGEGFLYPKVDTETCIDCGLCEMVCPVINQGAKGKPIAAYAAKNPDEEIRCQSSSGGIFTMLAERTIRSGGVVFGARFDEHWNVIHDYAETIEGVAAFRGSKYVQSRMGDCYRKVEMFLRREREVLFSGTPCQIAGLKKFLRKEYNNLVTMDVICHGVPSPGVWREYLNETVSGRIQAISFRDKREGWRHSGFALHTFEQEYYEPLNRNLFMRGFLADIYLRPSCYACPAKGFSSGSDLTLGDYWGIESQKPELEDGKGVSAILVNSVRGVAVLAELPAELYTASYDNICCRNPALVRSAVLPKRRAQFFVRDGQNVRLRIARGCRRSLFLRIRSLIISILKN